MKNKSSLLSSCISSIVLIPALAALLFSCVARAALTDTTWKGAGGANWSVTGNWSGGFADNTKRLVIDSSLSGGSPVVVNNSPTIGGMTIASTFTLSRASGDAANKTITINAATAADSYFNNAGTISSGGTSGSLILKVSNSALTIINSGTMEASTGTEFQFAPTSTNFITLSNTGGILRTVGSGTLTLGLSSGVSITGGILQNNAGTLNQRFTNTYTDVVVTNGGIENLDSGVSVGNPTGITLAGTTSFTNSGTFNITREIDNTSVAQSNAFSINSANASLSNSGQINVIVAGTGTASGANASLTFSVSSTVTNTGTITIQSQSTTNSARLTVAGGQTATLSGTGTLLMSIGAGGNASGVIVSGALGSLLVNSSGHTIRGAGLLGNNTLDQITNNGTINADSNTDALTIDPRTGAGAAGTFNNTGLVLASGSGGMVFNDGTYTNSGTIQVNAGSSLNISSGAALTSSGTVAVSGSLAGNFTNNGSVIFNPASAITYSGSIAGSGGLVKSGTGTVTLSGSNSFTGAVTIQNGVLLVNNVATVGSAQPLGGNNTVALGGTSTVGTLQYGGGTATLGQNITVGSGNGVISNTGAGMLTLSGTLTKANTVLTLSSGTFNITGKITGGTVGDFNSDFDVNGATVTISSANNNYTGPTVVYGGGTLLNGTNSALPVGTVLTTGTSGETSVINTYKLNGFDQTIAALNSAGGGTNIVSNGAASGTNTLTLTGTNADNLAANGNFGGSIQDGGAGKLALMITGGAHELSGSNSYTGPTDVKAGTLKVTGLLGNTTVTVGNASTGGLTPTLTGGIGSAGGSLFTPGNSPARQVYTPSASVGNIAGGVTLTGTAAGGSVGILSPGNAGVGTLAVGALTLSGGAILNYEFNGSANDFTVVAGALAINSGTVGINLFQEGGTSQFATNGTYDLFSYGSLAGSVSNLKVLNPNGGNTYTFGTTTVGGTNYVTLTIGTGGGATSTSYTLTASAGSTNILTGGTTGITNVITNTGTGTADTLNYTGLGVTSGAGGSVGGSTTSGGPLAQGASGTNAGQIFTGTQSGAVVVTLVGTGSNATAGGGATATGTTSVTVNVFDPASLSGAQSGTGTVVALTALNQSGTFRASAKVTADNGLSNNQGFTDVAVAPGTQINSGSSVTVASFDKTNRLNGTYTATKSLGYDNVTSSGSAITGGTGNTANVGLSVTVSGQTAGAGQTFNATLFSGQKYGTTTGSTSSGYGLTSAIAGDPHSGTTATLINGTASANTTVSMSFNTVPSAGAIHDTIFRTSDILSLGGIVATGTLGPDHSVLTDKYVLQLSYDPSAVGAQYIGWYDADQSQWVNAIAGDSTGGHYDGSGEFIGSYAAYLATLSGPQQANLAFQLNAFGYDVSTHTAWAVLDHNSEFAVIPETNTAGMILAGFGMLIGIQRLRKHRVGI